MSKDPLGLKRFIRTVDNFPIDGIAFRDITSLIETPEAFVKTCDDFDLDLHPPILQNLNLIGTQLGISGLEAKLQPESSWFQPTNAWGIYFFLW